METHKFVDTKDLCGINWNETRCKKYGNNSWAIIRLQSLRQLTNKTFLGNTAPTTTNISTITYMILKLCFFISLLELFSLQWVKQYPFNARSMERERILVSFSYNLQIILQFTAKSIYTCCSMNFFCVCRIWEKYMFFILNSAWKRTILPTLKRNNSK